MPKQAGSDLGIALVILRTIRGMTQQDLARRAGVRSASISDYESGKVVPGLARLQELLGAMEFPLSTLEETQRFLASVQRNPSVLDETGDDELPPDLDALTEEIGRVSARFARSVLVVLRRSERTGGCPHRQAEAPPQSERETARALWKELSRRSREDRLALLTKDPLFHRWAFCELLCKESITAAGRDPREAVELAEAAVFLARAITGEHRFTSRLIGHALAHLANARRVGGDMPAADDAMRESERLWAPAADSSDLLSDAVVYALRASLKRTQGQFTEAISLHDLALASSGADTLQTEILVSKAYTLDEAGDLPGVIATLEEATASLSSGADSRLLLSIRHNLVDALSKAGRYEEAQRLLPEVRRLAHTGSELDLVRLQWIEGRIAAGLGNFEEAIPLLLRARGALMAEGIALDAALLTLELTVIYLGHRRTSTVRDLARNLASLFQAQALPHETLAALNVFRQAAERETVTAELAEKLLAYLRKTRYNPQLRFEA